MDDGLIGLLAYLGLCAVVGLGCLAVLWNA